MTETERNWGLAALLLLGSVAAFAAIHAAEMASGRWNVSLRLVGEPAEAAMRFLGISHFLVAFFYLFTSKSMRTFRAVLSLLLMLVVGGALCGGFAWMRSFSPLVASGLFIAYFLVHDFRDQVFFYFTNKDGHDDATKALGKVLFWTPLLAVSVLAVIGTALIVVGVPGTEEAAASLGAFPAAWRWAVVAVPALFTVTAWMRIREHARAAGITSLRAHLRQHRAIHVVFAGSLSILVTSMVVGWRGYAIVILHVTTWYVFSWRQIARASADTVRTTKRLSPLQRLRGSVAGFNALHLGSAAALMIVGAVWAYGYRSDPSMVAVSTALDPAHFPFWTIVHVTASFRPR